MGTSGFWSFYSSLVKTIPINQIKGKIAFVDIILYLHKYVIGIRKSGADIKATNGKSIIHLFALTKIIKNFTDSNILPICVFDGKSPLIKSDSVEKRRELVELSRERCEELKKMNEENSDEYIKYFKRSFSITSEILNECREYIKLTGLPYINSIGEADPQCAVLSYYYSNISSGVFSEDSDILLYGASTLLRDFDIRTNCVSVIYSEDILKYLQDKSDFISIKHNINQKTFTKENLIDFSIIMGNDYCPGIRCSGSNNREKIFELFVLAQYNVEIFIEMINLINSNKFSYYIPENFISKWKESQDIYNNVNIIDPSLVDINMIKPNYSQLRKFLEKFSFRNDVIVHISDSLKDLYDYFNGAINISTPSEDNEWTVVGKNKKIRYEIEIMV
jgi:flap endonuclease-1